MLHTGRFPEYRTSRVTRADQLGVAGRVLRERREGRGGSRDGGDADGGRGRGGATALRGPAAMRRPYIPARLESRPARSMRGGGEDQGSVGGGGEGQGQWGTAGPLQVHWVSRECCRGGTADRLNGSRKVQRLAVLFGFRIIA